MAHHGPAPRTYSKTKGIIHFGAPGARGRSRGGDFMMPIIYRIQGPLFV